MTDATNKMTTMTRLFDLPADVQALFNGLIDAVADAHAEGFRSVVESVKDELDTVTACILIRSSQAEAEAALDKALESDDDSGDSASGSDGWLRVSHTVSHGPDIDLLLDDIPSNAPFRTTDTTATSKYYGLLERDRKTGVGISTNGYLVRTETHICASNCGCNTDTYWVDLNDRPVTPRRVPGRLVYEPATATTPARCRIVRD